jgi:hypothetical protein
MSGIEGVVVRIGAIVVLSEASYRFIEQPFRTGRAQATLRRLLDQSTRVRWTAAAVGTAVAGTMIAAVAVAQAPAVPEAAIGRATPAALAPIRNLRPTPLAALAGRTHAVPATTHSAATTRTLAPHTATATHTANPTHPGTTTHLAATPPPGPANEGPVLAIGDSVMLAAAADLNAVFGPAIVVDAGIGRHPADGLARLAAYRAAGRLRGLRVLVIGLGSNGPFSAANLTQLHQLAAGVPLVVLINVRVPDSWEAVSNQTIDSAAALPGYKVVDWYAASAQPGLLWPDGIHPDPTGQQVYAAMVAHAAAAAPAQTSTPAKLVAHPPSTAGGTQPVGVVGG